MKFLLGANLLIDYLGRKEPCFDDAQKNIAAGYFHDAELFVSAGSVKDAFYVLNHYVASERTQRSFTSLFEVVRPVALNAQELSTAAPLFWDDFEDCLIALSAVKASADYLITRNRTGFSRSMVHDEEKFEKLKRNTVGTFEATYGEEARKHRLTRTY